MLLKGLSLDGGVGSTNLGVHLEVNHCGWYQGGGLPSSMGRRVCAKVKLGPKLLGGPRGGPSSELMLQ